MAFARLYISKFSRGIMCPDSSYDTCLGREPGKLTPAPPQKFRGPYAYGCVKHKPISLKTCSHGLNFLSVGPNLFKLLLQFPTTESCNFIVQCMHTTAKTSINLWSNQHRKRTISFNVCACIFLAKSSTPS